MAVTAEKTLAQQSRETREKMRPIRTYGDPVIAGHRDREKRQIFALALTAANLAAAERKRHGRDSSPDEKSDAAQDALVWAYRDGTPTLTDLTDQDRPSVATFDGSREGLRPSREMIAAAGASLDAAHSGRALLDPAAGSGDLLNASAESRQAGDARRSVSAQLVDPSVSPIPDPVADALRTSGIWPDDPTRQAVIDWVCPDLTAQDWLDAGERGTTAAAIQKRRQRGAGKLEADPKARTLAEILTASLEPTDAERREAERVGAARLLEANPDGPTRDAAALIDPAWRTRQPTITPLKILGADADKSI